MHTLGHCPIKIEELKDNSVLHSDKIQRHNYWEIFLFKDATGKHLIDFETTILSANSVHIIPPNHAHQLNYSFCKGFILTISNEFFHGSNEIKELIPELYYHQLHHKSPVIKFTTDQFFVLCDIVKQIHKEISINNQENIIVLKNYLNIFLYKCHKGMVRKQFMDINRSDLSLFVMFTYFVEKHIQNHTKVSDYLKLLGTTKKNS